MEKTTRQQYNYIFLFIVGVILAATSAVMLSFWFKAEQHYINQTMSIEKSLGNQSDESLMLYNYSAEHFANLTNFALIGVLVCLSILCFTLAFFSRQNYYFKVQQMRYQALYDSAPVMYLTLNADFFISRVNLKVCDFLVMKSKDLEHSCFLEKVVAAEDRARCKKFLETVKIEGNGQIRCMWQGKGKDPTIVNLNCTTVFQGDRQSSDDILICAEDITAEHKANEHIKTLSMILENLDDVVVVTSKTGIIEYLNPAGEQLFLMDQSKCLGKNIATFFSETFTSKSMDNIRKIVQERGVWQGDIQCQRDDGFDIVVAARVSVLPGQTGKENPVIFTMRDITYQKQIIAELQQSEDKYRTIFDQAPLSIILLDANGCILDINNWHIERVEESKNSRAEYLTRSILELKYLSEAGLDSHLRNLLNGEPFEVPQARLFFDKDRPPRIMCVSGLPLFNDVGQVRGSMILLEDVTDRYELQEKIWHHSIELEEKTQLALQANRMKSEFLTNVSHELRTPLNAIIGFTRLVQKKNKALISDAQYKNLQHILDSAYNLLDLINDILNISKIEAGRLDVHVEQFNFSQFIDGIIKTAEPLMERNNNLFTYKIDPIIINVTNDITKFRQIIINLLSNAAKFTQQGKITMKAWLEESKTENVSDNIKIAIIDNGPGIPDDKIDDIFEAFSQADGSPARKFEGTGLGLTISKRYCLMMRGNIEVESTLGQGTTFTLTIPTDYFTAVSTAVIPMRDVDTSQALSSASERQITLVVGDDPILIRILRRHFNNKKVIITGASNYTEAISKTHYLFPSLIFLDLRQYADTGWQFVHAIKSQSHTKDIPIIPIDGSRKEDPHISWQLNTILKPINNSALERIILRNARIENCTAFIIDDDTEYLKQCSDVFKANDIPHVVCQSFKSAFEKSLNLNIGMLMMNVTHLDTSDVEFFQKLICRKPIGSLCIIAWQRMSEEEHDSTLQFMKILVAEHTFPLDDLLDSLPERLDSVESFFETFRLMTQPVIK